MEDSTHETDYHVAILSHESLTIPFEETIVGLLTQFCRSLSASLHTSILVEGMHAPQSETTDTPPDNPQLIPGSKRPRQPSESPQPPQPQPLVLVDYTRDYNHYLKELVPTTAHFERQSADVLIALCHGFGPEDGSSEAGLAFQCTHRPPAGGADIAVFARRQTHTQNVTLHSVIQGCKLAMLLCCRGTDILAQYTHELQGSGAHKPLHFPDLLVCDTTTVETWSVEIYMVLLMNILNASDIDLDSFHDDTKAAIHRIMQIVRLFGDDHVSFWAFLQHVGCVTDVADEQDRQELDYPPSLSKVAEANGGLDDSGNRLMFFRVYGRVCPYSMGHFPHTLLEDFKTITLVECGRSRQPQYTTCHNVPDITFTAQEPSRTDRYLRRYQRLTAPRPFSRASSASSLGPYPHVPTPPTPSLAKMTQALAQLYLLQ